MKAQVNFDSKTFAFSTNLMSFLSYSTARSVAGKVKEQIKQITFNSAFRFNTTRTVANDDLRII